MERDLDFRPEPPDDELSDLAPDDPGPPVDPGEPDPPPGGPLGFDGDPATGPWFLLAMTVAAAWTALILMGLSAGTAVDRLLTWGLIGGFLVVYLAFLLAGAAWFGAWRRRVTGHG